MSCTRLYAANMLITMQKRSWSLDSRLQMSSLGSIMVPPLPAYLRFVSHSHTHACIYTHYTQQAKQMLYILTEPGTMLQVSGGANFERTSAPKYGQRHYPGMKERSSK